MKRDAKFYWTLFRSTFSLSAFTVGGGFVIVPLMKQKFVDGLHWIDEDEMLDIAAIAQSAPGAIAVNAAILVGYRLAGIVGALVTIFGTILPPLLLLSVISVFYQAFQDNDVRSLSFTKTVFSEIRGHGGSVTQRVPLRIRVSFYSIFNLHEACLNLGPL